jgi:hypothetical protein
MDSGVAAPAGLTMVPSADALDLYRRHTRMSDPGPHAALIEALPSDIPSIARAAQGLILHEHWAGAYGQTLSDDRRDEVHLRALRSMLDRVLRHDANPLDLARPPERRVIGNCRDYSLFATAVLRAHGVAARARCGFATYFEPGRFIDHWVCEYWRADEGRWVMADAQIDAVQASRLEPDFDVLDVPPTRFLTAGAAWRACRADEADPAAFGIMHMCGLWFVAGNLVRDAASLAGFEMLPWDCWGAMPGSDEPIAQADLAWFDRLAALTAALTADLDAALDALVVLNRDDERQRVPPVVFNAVRQRSEAV